MTRLCDPRPSPCSFGFAGDIDPPEFARTTPWRDRLIGGSETASQVIYGLRLDEVARMINFVPVCQALVRDANLGDVVVKDARAGGQLATLYRAISQRCRPGANPGELRQARDDILELARLRYEPAEFLAAFEAIDPIWPKLSARASPAQPLIFSTIEVTSLESAFAYLSGAADRGWTAARFVRFDWCRLQLASCAPGQMEKDLRASAAEGQIEALRSMALAFLIGDAPEYRAKERFNFALPQDTARGLTLLRENALPKAGLGADTAFLRYDNYSAAYLSYLYFGGTYRGERLVTENLALAAQYEQQCYGGYSPILANAFHSYCMWIGAIGRFNHEPRSAMRDRTWRLLVGFDIPNHPLVMFAKNVATWPPDGRDINRIDCPLDDTFTLVPLPRPQPISPATAYCCRNECPLSRANKPTRNV